MQGVPGGAGKCITQGKSINTQIWALSRPGTTLHTLHRGPA